LYQVQTKSSMKNIFPFLILLTFLFQACNSFDNKPGKSNGSLTGKDTLTVNLLLKKESESNDSLLHNILKAKTLAKKIGYEQGFAEALFREGNIYSRENRYKEALTCLLQACELADKQDLFLLKGNCLERMASLHLGTDDPNLALKQYYESLVLFEKIHDTAGIARVYNIIGVYKTDTREFDTAAYYLKTALRINTKRKDVHNMIHNKGNLAYLYERKGLLDSAVKIYNDLIPELLSIHDRSTLTVIYYDLAGLDQKKRDIPAAFGHIHQAIAIAESTGDTIMLSVLYGNTGEMLLDAGKTDSALFFLQKSYFCACATKDVETEVQALSFIATIDSIKGNFQSSFSVFQKIRSLSDTVTLQKIKNNVKTSELKYENQKKQNLIDIQDLKLKAQKKERWLYFILLLLSVMAVSIMVLLFLLRKKQFRKNIQLREQEVLIGKLEIDRMQKQEEISRLKLEKSEEEVKTKERELISIALRVDQKNESLDFITKKLKELTEKKADLNTNSLLTEIESAIKLRMNEKSDADLFNERFSIVHHDFFKDLKEKHPDLTKTELKFCAYLRVHLSSGQIATILNITNEAIRKARYRIRKKMDLPPDASLEDYISNF